MVALSVREFKAMYIKWGGDDAPDEGVEGSTDEDDDGGDDEIQAQEQGEPSAQREDPTMMDWEATQAFHSQLHEEQMAYLRAQSSRQEEHFQPLYSTQNEEIFCTRRAVEENVRLTQELQAQFARQLHPPSFGD
nr:hypothetical protein Iba_chr15aCG12290 [Ipomoea batatas]